MTQNEKISAIGSSGFVIGLATGIVYATKSGKSKFWYAVLGALVIGTVAATIAKLTIKE